MRYREVREGDTEWPPSPNAKLKSAPIATELGREHCWISAQSVLSASRFVVVQGKLSRVCQRCHRSPARLRPECVTTRISAAYAAFGHRALLGGQIAVSSCEEQSCGRAGQMYRPYKTSPLLTYFQSFLEMSVSRSFDIFVRSVLSVRSKRFANLFTCVSVGIPAQMP